MGSVADRAQTIEGRNAEGGGEIAVRSATDRCLGKLEAELFGGPGRHAVEAHGCGRTPEGSTLHASEDLQAAARIARAQLMDSSIYAGGLGCSEESHIDNNFGKIGDHVRANASGDESGIEGEPLGGTGEPADGDDLLGGFDDGRGTALEVESGVGGPAMDAQGIAGHALARGFASAGGSGSGFEDKHGTGAEGEALGERARSGAADLFVGNEQEGDGAGQRAACKQGSEGEKSLDDSGFHVECAGTGEASGVLSAGHGRQSAEGVDGVSVAEQEQARRAARAWEIDLQGGAAIAKFVLADARGECGEIGGDQGDQGGDGVGRGGG